MEALFARGSDRVNRDKGRGGIAVEETGFDDFEVFLFDGNTAADADQLVDFAGIVEREAPLGDHAVDAVKTPVGHQHGGFHGSLDLGGHEEVHQSFRPAEDAGLGVAGDVEGRVRGADAQDIDVGGFLTEEMGRLDEPHEGLAPKVAEEVVDAIVALKAEGVSMLISEQALHTIRRCADRVYVVDRGVTVWNGTVEEFYDTPEITQKYLMVQ